MIPVIKVRLLSLFSFYVITLKSKMNTEVIANIFVFILAVPETKKICVIIGLSVHEEYNLFEYTILHYET